MKTLTVDICEEHGYYYARYKKEEIKLFVSGDGIFVKLCGVSLVCILVYGNLHLWISGERYKGLVSKEGDTIRKEVHMRSERTNDE